jgi:hypothetical protein
VVKLFLLEQDDVVADSMSNDDVMPLMTVAARGYEATAKLLRV